MDWNETYNKMIASLRDFVGLMIEWIDRIFWPWTLGHRPE